MLAKKADPSNMLPIVRLVRERVALSGMGLRPFAERTGVSYSTLRVYHDANLKPLKQPPRPETMRELALALDVPLSEVERAADASVGRVYREQLAPDVSAFMASLEELTPQQRARTAAELRRLLDEMTD